MSAKWNQSSRINYINLKESKDRFLFMENQFKEYNIQNYKRFSTERFEEYRERVIINGPYVESVNHHGTNITFLRCIKNWLDETDEEYGIFLEDDTSFITSHSWSFSWNEFFYCLPKNWEIVQLIRINDFSDHREAVLNIRNRQWDDWGASCMMRRSYAEKLLKSYMVNYNEYLFDIVNTDLMPIVENLLFTGGVCYNVPLFIETDLPSTYKRGLDPIHEQSRLKYKELWETQGLNKSIKEFLV